MAAGKIYYFKTTLGRGDRANSGPDHYTITTLLRLFA
jgi:hypothetical protein